MFPVDLQSRLQCLSYSPHFVEEETEAQGREMNYFSLVNSLSKGSLTDVCIKSSAKV